MDKVLDFLKGRKTYIIAIATATLGVLQGLDIFIVPEWAWAVVAAVGFAAMRAGVNKVADTVKPK